MKKYTFTYKNKEYIENPYDFKSTTILKTLLPQLEEQDVEKLKKSFLNIKHIENSNYSSNIKTTKVGQNHILNINYSNKFKIQNLRKLVLEPNAIEIFNLKPSSLNSSEVKIWYPQNKEILTEFKTWIDEYKNEHGSDKIKIIEKRKKYQKILTKKYPLEKIKSFSYEKFNEFTNYLEYNKEIEHPSTRGGTKNKWGYAYSKDNSGIVRSDRRKIKNPNFEEFKLELFEILKNYKNYKFANDIEFNNKFKYITSNVFALYERSYIYITEPHFNNIFISRGKLELLSKFLYLKDDYNKFKILNFGEMKFILNEFLNEFNILEEQKHGLLWWIIDKKVEQYMENLESSENNLTNEIIQDENVEEDENEFVSFLDEKLKNSFIDQLQNYKNVIVEGVPGIGKTYNIKYFLQEEGYKITNIQFHKSYSYEEFVEGYKPSKNGNFELKSGVILDLIHIALNDSDNKYALIIDEINRGDIMSIFGELFTLIEKSKRSEFWKMKLQYSKKEIYIPSNLHIIGTMNNLDLTLNELDFALQRRFKFIRWEPNFKLLKEYLLETYKNSISEEIVVQIITLFESLNNQIKQEFSNDHILGISYISDLFPEPDTSNSSLNNEIIESYNDLLETNIKKLLQSYSYGEQLNIDIDNFKIDIEDFVIGK